MASVVVVLAGLKAAQDLLLPLLFSLMLAILTAPAVALLRRCRVPQPLAIAVVVFGVLGVLLSVTAVVGATLQDFYANLPRYQERIGELLNHWMEQAIALGLPESSLEASGTVDPSAIMSLVGATLGPVLDVSSNALLVVLLLSFMLFEIGDFPRKLTAALADNGQGWKQFSEATGAIQRYLGIKTVISLVTGGLLGGFVGLMGLDFPLLWGLVAFLLNYIPSIGSIIAAVPAVTLATVQLGPGPAAVIASGYFAVNIGLGSVVEPRLMGRRLGLSPLVVFTSLVFWGWMWGPAGMLLSVPLTVVVKIILEHRPSTRWIGVLLGPGGDAETTP